MLKSTGTILARNAIYNFITQIIVSVLAFVSIPFIVRGMGEEAFGLLSLIWMVVGYFSILDLGVGQASVKFLAEQIARNELEEANATIWVSVLVSAVLGLVTSLVIMMLIPVAMSGIVSIPPGLQPEARHSMYWVSLAVPFVMLQGAFRALPMAVQRFDLFNLMIGLSGLLQWAGSLILVLLGMGLLEVVVLTVAVRVVGAVAAYVIAVRLFPNLSFRRIRSVKATAKTLLGFGGWLTVSQAVSPVTRYLDRIFVASYHSLKIFTYYTVPYEAMSRLQVIPLSLSTTLFPAMSEREGVKGKAQSFPLFMRAINLTLIVMLPVSLTLIVFSKPILQLWLGGDFPLLSNTVFQILAATVFLQAVGYVPLTSLQAMGRPDLAAKYYLAEIPFYVLLCLVLIPPLGIEGAAWALCLRMITNVGCFFWLAHRTLGAPVVSLAPIGKSLLLNGFALVCLVVVESLPGLVSQLAGVCTVGAAYVAAAWLFSLDMTEREAIRNLVFSRRAQRDI